MLKDRSCSEWGFKWDFTERGGSREQAQSQNSVHGLYELTANGRLREGQSKKNNKKNPIFSKRQQTAAPLGPQNVCYFSYIQLQRLQHFPNRSLSYYTAKVYVVIPPTSPLCQWTERQRRKHMISSPSSKLQPDIFPLLLIVQAFCMVNFSQ